MTVNRRKLLKVVGATGSITLAGCLSSNNGSGNTDTKGQGGRSTESTSDQSRQYHIGFSIMGLGGDPWMGAFRNGAEWYSQDQNLKLTVTDGEFDSSKQIKDAKRLIRQGVDALLTSPVQSDAAVQIVEAANAENIPVFTANSTASTGDVPMFTAFGNANAAATAAEVMAKRLKQRNGTRKGTVVEVMLPQDTETFVDRHKGFVNQMKKYSDIDIIAQIQYDQTQQDAANKIATQLQQTDNFDGLYCPDLLSGLAAMSAFENQGVKKRIGKEKHITTVGLDAGPTTLEAIRNEYFDAAIDQPVLFYAPISMKYMVDYLDAGQDPSVIPKVGQKITPKDLTIATGNKHSGINPWAKPLWAPAQIEALEFDNGDQTYFKTSSVIVTKENADAPYLWGNLQ